MTRITTDLITARREELEALVAQHGDTITPQQIVEFAANPNTALHSMFEWNDTEAAKRYREAQAQGYLRAVVRLMPAAHSEEPMAVRGFVSLSSDRGTGIYRPITKVLSDEEKRSVLVQDALRELQALRTKYGHLQELARVWDAAAAVTPLERVA